MDERRASGSARIGRKGRKEAEADQSPAEPKTADERSRACVSPLSFFTAAESSVRRPETCPKMMLKLVHLLGVLVCGSQGRDCSGERADSLLLWRLCGQVECMFVFLSFLVPS